MNLKELDNNLFRQKRAINDLAQGLLSWSEFLRASHDCHLDREDGCGVCDEMNQTQRELKAMIT